MFNFSNPDTYVQDPCGKQYPADNGRIKNQTHPVIQIVRTETWIPTISWMKGIGEPG